MENVRRLKKILRWKVDDGRLQEGDRMQNVFHISIQLQ